MREGEGPADGLVGYVRDGHLRPPPSTLLEAPLSARLALTFFLCSFSSFSHHRHHDRSAAMLKQNIEMKEEEIKRR